MKLQGLMRIPKFHSWILYSKIDSGVDPLAENKEEEEVKKEIVDDENDF